jgi:hypothetical protein
MSHLLVEETTIPPNCFGKGFAFCSPQLPLPHKIAKWKQKEFSRNFMLRKMNSLCFSL